MSAGPQTIREQITNQIRDKLVSGTFPSGSMLRETELASELGVSRGPIRDAFIQLSYEGFLSYQANRGVTVRSPPDPADREFITSVRQQIEIYVIEKGIESLQNEDIERVQNALQSLKQACDAGDSALLARHDIAFHQSIMVACGGEDFVAAWRQLCARMLLTYTRLGNYDQAYREHEDIFKALKSKDKRATIAAIKSNIR